MALENPNFEVNDEELKHQPWFRSLRDAKRHLKVKNYRAALQALNKALLDSPRDKLQECYSLRAFIQLNLHDYSSAENDSNSVIDINSQADESYIWRGSARSGQQRWTEAIRDFQRATNLNPDNQQRCAELIEHAARESIEEIRHIARSGKMKPEHWYERAFAYRAIGEYEKALRDANLAVRAESGDYGYRMLRAETYLESAQYEKAITDLTTIIEDDRERCAQALRYRCKAYLKLAKRSEAFRDLNRVKSLLPTNIENLMQCGRLRASEGDYVGACEEFTTVLKLDSNNHQAYFERGSAQAATRNFRSAQEDFDSALEHGSNVIKTLLQRGNCNLSRRLLDEAASDFSRVIELDETSSEAHLGLAKTCFERRDFQQAGRLCNKVLRLDPRCGPAFIVKGGVHFEKKEYDSAILSFSQALESTHDEEAITNAYYRRGIARTEAKLQPDAISDFNNVILRNPSHSGAMFWRANAKAKKGLWLDSLEDLQMAIDVGPEFATAYRKFGQLVAVKAIAHLRSLAKHERQDIGNRKCRAMALLMLDRSARAIKSFDRILAANPNDFLYRIRCGQAQLALGLNDEAAEDFRHVIRHDSKFVLAYECLARCWLAKGDVEVAIEEYSKAIAIKPDDDRLRVLRGRAYADLGDVSNARDDFMEAISIRPNNYEAYRERGMMYLAADKPRRAIQQFDISTEINPRQPELILRRGELLLKLQKWKDARKDFEFAVTQNPNLVRAHCGRALAMLHSNEHEDALIWLTKSLHRFEEVEDIVEVLSTRARVFFSMGRYPRAVAEYSTVIQLLEQKPAESRRIAPSYYARGIAHFHCANTAAAESDWRKSMSLNPEQDLGTSLLSWSLEKTDQVPEQLVPQEQTIAPTRPPVIGKQITSVKDPREWHNHPPYDLWIVQYDLPKDAPRNARSQYGPVTKEILNDWCQEGRISADTKLLRADWSRWKRASAVFEELAPPGKRSVSSPQINPEENLVADQNSAEDMA